MTSDKESGFRKLFLWFTNVYMCKYGWFRNKNAFQAIPRYGKERKEYYKKNAKTRIYDTIVQSKGNPSVD